MSKPARVDQAIAEEAPKGSETDVVSANDAEPVVKDRQRKCSGGRRPPAHLCRHGGGHRR
jgi:hypothetical protein